MYELLNIYHFSKFWRQNIQVIIIIIIIIRDIFAWKSNFEEKIQLNHNFKNWLRLADSMKNWWLNRSQPTIKSGKSLTHATGPGFRFNQWTDMCVWPEPVHTFFKKIKINWNHVVWRKTFNLVGSCCPKRWSWLVHATWIVSVHKVVLCLNVQESCSTWSNPYL